MIIYTQSEKEQVQIPKTKSLWVYHRL